MTDNNVVMFNGRIVKDAETEIKNGLTISRFTVAVNRDVKMNDGSKGSAASYINLTIFDKFAEGMSPYILKGTQVSVIGHLKENRWTDEKGNHSMLGVVVDKMQLMGGKKKEAENTITGPNTFEEPIVSYENESPMPDDLIGFF